MALLIQRTSFFMQGTSAVATGGRAMRGLVLLIGLGVVQLAWQATVNAWIG